MKKILITAFTVLFLTACGGEEDASKFLGQWEAEHDGGVFAAQSLDIKQNPSSSNLVDVTWGLGFGKLRGVYKVSGNHLLEDGLAAFELTTDTTIRKISANEQNQTVFYKQ